MFKSIVLFSLIKAIRNNAVIWY